MFWKVKEDLCYVTMNYEAEENLVKMSEGRPLSAGIRKTYTVPESGETITLETERFHCPETMFQPSWVRMDAMGVHKVINEAVVKCPKEYHKKI